MDSVNFRSRLDSVIRQYVGMSGDRAAMVGNIVKAVDDHFVSKLSKESVLELIREEVRYYIDPSTLTTKEAEKKECFDEIVALIDEFSSGRWCSKPFVTSIGTGQV